MRNFLISPAIFLRKKGNDGGRENEFLEGKNSDVSRQIKQEMLIIELLSFFRFGGGRRREGRFARKKGDTWSDGRFSPKEGRRESLG